MPSYLAQQPGNASFQVARVVQATGQEHLLPQLLAEADQLAGGVGAQDLPAAPPGTHSSACFTAQVPCNHLHLLRQADTGRLAAYVETGGVGARLGWIRLGVGGPLGVGLGPL